MLAFQFAPVCLCTLTIILILSPLLGLVSVLAGGGGGGGIASGTADGVGTAALFHNPNGLAIDKTGHIYVCDVSSSRIRLITPSGMSYSSFMFNSCFYHNHRLLLLLLLPPSTFSNSHNNNNNNNNNLSLTSCCRSSVYRGREH